MGSHQAGRRYILSPEPLAPHPPKQSKTDRKEVNDHHLAALGIITDNYLPTLSTLLRKI